MSFFSRIFYYYRDKFRMKVRSFSKPISPDEALEKREFFAKLYALSAIAAFGCFVYSAGKRGIEFDYGPEYAETKDPTIPIRKLGIKGDVKVITISGFKIEDSYIFNADRPNERIRVKSKVQEDFNPSSKENKTSEFDSNESQADITLKND